MRENIFEYIKILLPKHKCVTIPGFGAFILNKEDRASYANDIAMPTCSVVFNSRLQHDDGVLSSYIQATLGISYEKASKELANAVKEIRSSLLLKKEIDCSTLGKIELIDSNIIFTPSNQYVFPQHYGLSPVSLSTLSTINKDIHKEVKVVSIRKRLVLAASSVAVVLLLILPSTHITDSATENNQQASFLKSLVAPDKVVVSQSSNESLPIISPIEEINIPKVAESKPDTVESTLPVASNKSSRSYYLIVAGESTKDRALKTLEKFKAEGFNNPQILSSAERHRIYVASFDSKAKAELYLMQFRKDNPKYESAWIHSKRN